MWRTNRVRMTIVAGAVALVAVGSAWAQQKAAAKPEPKAMPAASEAEAKAKEMAKEGMPEHNWYLIVSPHTQEECLAALDGVQAKGTAALGQWDWGCKAGQHNGYMRVHAANAEEALANVPAEVRSKASVIALNKFSEADLKSFHEMMKH